MYWVDFTEHTLECSVIVIGVLGRHFVREEQRRAQELCVGLDGSLLEVEAVGHITCAEVELVRQIHTLVVRKLKLSSSFKYGNKWKECDKKCVKWKGESKVEESCSLHEHVDDLDDKHKTHDLGHGACATTMCQCTDK